MADSPLPSSSRRGQLIDPCPADGTQFDYVNVDAFFTQLRSIATSFTDEQRTNGPWILVTSVDEQAFKSIQESHHELLDSWSILYSPVDYTISTKMEDIHLGTLAMAITRWLDGKLTTMGLNHEAIFTGTANHTVFALDRAGQKVINDIGLPNLIRKRADQTVHPFTVQAPRSMKWPSLVLEVSHSDSRTQIGEDLRLWLQNSESEVKFVMAAFITPRSKTISIEEWKVRTRAGTHGQLRYTAERTQFISIEKPQSDGDPIITGSFKMPFDKLLLHQPTANETDFDMSQEDHCQIAAQIWRLQSIGDAWRR